MKAFLKNSMLMLASVMMIAACGGSGDSKGRVRSADRIAETLTKEQVIEYGEIGYADLISAIVEGYQSHWAEIVPEALGLSPVYGYSSPLAGFVQKDIDGDGFDELLIGDQFEDGSYALYDIYCFDKQDASLIHLASGGERDRFVINGAGVIIETGSNGADDSFTKAFRIKDGKLEEVSGPWDESLMVVELERFSSLTEPLLGGYTDQREPSGEEMAMFKAVTGIGELVLTPLSVSTQVVAGTNYKFWCRYQDGEDSGHCWVVIFKPLPGQGEPRLASLEKEE